jgi:hypothetical protein
MDIHQALLILAFAIIGLLLIIIYLLTIPRRPVHKQPGVGPAAALSVNSDNATCGGGSQHSCGALDPVNDPDYNMRNIAKQSILLEEHLAEKNKYCIGCITKHFLHIIGLAEEGVWLAGVDLAKFPLLEGSPAFYQDLMNAWANDKHNEALVKEILAALRERRRHIIDSYF